MNIMQQQVAKFHDKFGHPISLRPTLIPKARGKLRYELIREEAKEYKAAVKIGDIVEIADALGDILYVTLGAALEHGLDMQPIFDEIQRSNMSKLGRDGAPVLRSDGKILKGPDYTAPQLDGIVAEQVVR